MNRIKKYIRLVTAFTLIITLVSCEGETLSSMKDFESNEKPVITSFTHDIAEGTELERGMQFNLTVLANDPDGTYLDYEFTSESASFRNLTLTDTGCTVECFISPDCSSSESVILTVTASDIKGAETEISMDIGDGNAEPTLTVNWPAVKTVKSGVKRDVIIKSNYSGYYQVSTKSTFDSENVNSYSYTKKSDGTYPEVTETVGTGDSTLNLSLSSTVYVIFRDRLGREVSTSAYFTVSE